MTTEQNLKASHTINTIDTLRNQSDSIMSKPEIFETAFIDGTEVYVDTLLLTFYPLEAGKINIESRKIIACDPVMMYNNFPFITDFPVGQFPVQLALACVDTNQVIAFSRIIFSQAPVIKWEFALTKGQKQISIFGDSAYFYPVDGGLGQFIDEKMYNKFNKMDTESQSEIMDNLIKELEKKCS